MIKGITAFNQGWEYYCHQRSVCKIKGIITINQGWEYYHVIKGVYVRSKALLLLIKDGNITSSKECM